MESFISSLSFFVLFLYQLLMKYQFLTRLINYLQCFKNSIYIFQEQVLILEMKEK